MGLCKRRIGPASGGDAGQLPIALIMLVFFGLMLVIFQFGLPLGKAADQKAGSQASADAAALAAAEQITKDLPDDINAALAGIKNRDGLIGLLDFLVPAYGAQGATRFAGLNDGDVTSFAFNRRSGEIAVTVQGRAATAGQHSVSRSRAKLGLRLGDCELEDDDTPSPTPSDPDQPPAKDQPPPNIGTELRCGDLVLHFTLNGKNGRPTLDSTLDEVTDQFRIRLIA